MVHLYLGSFIGGNFSSFFGRKSKEQKAEMKDTVVAVRTYMINTRRKTKKRKCY